MCKLRGPLWLRNLWSLQRLLRKRAIKGRGSFCLAKIPFGGKSQTWHTLWLSIQSLQNVTSSWELQLFNTEYFIPWKPFLERLKSEKKNNWNKLKVQWMFWQKGIGGRCWVTQRSASSVTGVILCIYCKYTNTQMHSCQHFMKWLQIIFL